MEMRREIELKLELDSGDDVSLRWLPIPPGRRQSAKRLHSVYFDTPKRLLAKAGVSLRIRTIEGQRTQTIKSAARPGAGLFNRREIEQPVEGSEPDLSRTDDSELRQLFSRQAIRKNLRPIFETVVERTVRRVSSDGADIEVTVDKGEVRAGSKRLSLRELELELKSGPPRALFDLANRCNSGLSLRLGVESKSERGYALLDARCGSIVKSEPVHLSPRVTSAEGFQAIAAGCIRHFRRNETALREKRDAEALHQARVAIRRLRSALSLFRDMTEDSAVERLKRDLQAFSRQLGAARNIDVFLAGSVASEVKRPDAAPGTENLEAGARERREAAYDSVIETLDSAVFRKLMIDLAAWLSCGPWLTSDDPRKRKLRNRKLKKTAAEVLDACLRKVKRRGRHLDVLEPAARHRVRIEAKKLRYASEFFASLYDSAKAKRRHAAFLETLERLQAKLGDLNDLVTGRELANDLSQRPRLDQEDGADPLALPAGQLVAEGDNNAAALVPAAAKAHAALSGAKPFWQ